MFGIDYLIKTLGLDKTEEEREAEWEKIREQKMKELEEYAEHFDGYGNVKCKYCDTWVDTEYMGSKCPVCNAEIPKYEWK